MTDSLLNRYVEMDGEERGMTRAVALVQRHPARDPYTVWVFLVESERDGRMRTVDHTNVRFLSPPAPVIEARRRSSSASDWRHNCDANF